VQNKLLFNQEFEKFSILFSCGGLTFTMTFLHGISEGRCALDRALLPLVPYPKRPRAFFVSFFKTYYKLKLPFSC
jgi:hypothetical protein